MADINIDDEGSSSSCSSPYWKFLDSMILRRKRDIKNEMKLLGEVYYSTKTFRITVGLSIARGMLPAVKLTNTLINLDEKDVSISLVDFDWNEFLTIIAKIMEDNPADMTTIGSETENFTVSSVIFFGERVIKLNCNDVTLCFSVDDVVSLLKLKTVVNYKIALFKTLDFRSHYDNSLIYINTYISDRTHLFKYITDTCNLNVSEYSYLMLEMINFYPNKVLEDFGTLLKICNE